MQKCKVKIHITDRNLSATAVVWTSEPYETLYVWWVQGWVIHINSLTHHVSMLNVQINHPLRCLWPHIYPSISCVLTCCSVVLCARWRINSWSRQEHPATQCRLLMAEQRGDELWWLLILAVGLQRDGSYWSCTPAAVNHSAAPLHHEKPSACRPQGFVKTRLQTFRLAKSVSSLLITLNMFLSAGFYHFNIYCFSFNGTLWSVWPPSSVMDKLKKKKKKDPSKNWLCKCSARKEMHSTRLYLRCLSRINGFWW